MTSNGNMSDIWIGWVNPNASSNCAHGCIFDYYVAAYTRPTLDPPTSQSLTLIKANFTAETNLTSVEFSRDLDTGDEFDRVIMLNETTTFIWALNPNSIPDDFGTPFFKHTSKGVVALNLSEASQCTPPKNKTHSFTNADGTYTAEWIISQEDQTIQFTLTAATTGWVGIGFGADMTKADIYVGWIYPNGSVTMTDRNSKAFAMPLPDTAQGGEDNVLNVKVNKNNGLTSITFTRLLDTGDSLDTVILPGTISVLWAYGSNNSVDYNLGTFTKHVQKGSVEIDFFSGCVYSSFQLSLFELHGILMVISICIVIFPGMLLARYFKLIMRKWFYFHIALQLLGFTGIIVSFVIVFVIAKDRKFTVGLHEVFGLVAVCAFGLEVFFGVISHCMFNPSRPYPPIFPDRMHWWLGRGAFLWSLVTILLGLLFIEAPMHDFVVYMVWLGCAIIVVTILQTMVGQTHEATEELERLVNSESYIKNYGRWRKPVYVLLAMVAVSIGLLLFALFYRLHRSGGLPDFGGYC